MRTALFSLALAGAVAVSGCTVGPKYKKPESKLPATFTQASATQTIDVAALVDDIQRRDA